MTKYYKNICKQYRYNCCPTFITIYLSFKPKNTVFSFSNTFLLKQPIPKTGHPSGHPCKFSLRLAQNPLSPHSSNHQDLPSTNIYINFVAYTLKSLHIIKSFNLLLLSLIFLLIYSTPLPRVSFTHHRKSLLSSPHIMIKLLYPMTPLPLMSQSKGWVLSLIVKQRKVN